MFFSFLGKKTLFLGKNMLSIQRLVCGRGGMVDTLVLEANAKSVRVRVSSSAPSI